MTLVDVVDIAGSIEAEAIASAVARAAEPLRTGAPGECEGCDWWMPRLVDGLCGFCRDGRRRPDDWEPPVRPDRPTATPAAPHPAPSETPSMPSTSGSKSIMLPASAQIAILAIEQLSTADDVSLGVAAATLIQRGIVAGVPAAEAPAELARTPRQRMVALLDGVSELLIEQIEAAATPAVDPELVAARDAWKARAEEAEAKLAQMKALFA